MELVKDIYFNTDKLVENTRVKISYTGKFYQGNNEKVFIHYGYGKNWNNVNEMEMTKTDLGYQTELDLNCPDTLNFCFKNQNDEWDNNLGKNYIFNIEKNNLKVNNCQPQNSNNTSFFGKAFGNVDKNKSVSSIYWNSKNNSKETTNSGVSNTQTPQCSSENTDDSISGVIEDNKVGAPNSIDTVLNTTPHNSISQNFNQPNTNSENPNKLGSFNVITPNLDNNSTSNVSNIFSKDCIATLAPEKVENSNTVIHNFVGNTPIQNSLKINNNISNINKQPITTAIAVTPTGLRKTYIWTKKIKLSVCKFFAYVPKLISGNYKRDVIENKNNK